MRRQFQLSEEDEECLAVRSANWEAIVENNTKWVIVPDFAIPEGYNHRSASAALRMPPSYPDDQIDMVYFYPALALTNGRGSASSRLSHLMGSNTSSGHVTGSLTSGGRGIDNICTHMLQVDVWLKNELRG